MNRVEIKRFLMARGITRAVDEVARATGLCTRSASLKLQGKRQFTADEIETMRKRWGLTDEQTIKFFIENS